jgi:hypothetical protein
MRVIPNWLIVLVVIAVVLLVLNATRLLNIHFNVSAEVWPNPLPAPAAAS